jgi:hypothetical protein
MATALFFQIADFSFYPHFSDINLNDVFDAPQQLRDG